MPRANNAIEDAEIEAINRVHKVLVDLDQATKNAVLEFINRRHGSAASSIPKPPVESSFPSSNGFAKAK